MVSIGDQVRYNNTNLTYYISKINLTNDGIKYTLVNENETPRHVISQETLLNNFTNYTLNHKRTTRHLPPDANHERKTRHLTPDTNSDDDIKDGGRKTRRNKLRKKRRKTNRRKTNRRR